MRSASDERHLRVRGRGGGSRWEVGGVGGGRWGRGRWEVGRQEVGGGEVGGGRWGRRWEVG